MEVETELEYLVNVREHLSSLGMPSDVVGPLSTEMASESTVLRFPDFPPGTMGLMIPKTYWVIRNDDLRLMETLWPAIAAATAVISLKSLTATATVAILGSTFKIVRAARSKGVSLTPIQHRLILALKSSDQGSTIAALVSKMRSMPNQEELSEADVLTELSALKSIRLNDGTVVGLVAEDGKGLWSAAGI